MKKTLGLTALLVSSALSSTAIAQTTVTGNIALGLSGKTNDSATKTEKSFRQTIRETQVNIRNNGKLSNGIDYQAGFSFELDGEDLSTTTGNSNPGLTNGWHYENTYINLKFGNTLVHFGSDHFQNPDADMTNIVGGETDVDNVVNFIDGTALSKVGGNNSPVGRTGTGILQTVPGIGNFSVYYAPEPMSGTSSANSSIKNVTLGNSAYEIGFVGDLGVKGLTAAAFYNKERTADKGGFAPSNNDLVGIAYKLKYVAGSVVPAAEYLETKAASGVKVKTKQVGLGFLATKQMTLGLNYATTEKDATTIDEKIRGLAIGYNLGPMVVHGWVADIENAANVADKKGKGALLKATLAF